MIPGGRKPLFLFKEALEKRVDRNGLLVTNHSIKPNFQVDRPVDLNLKRGIIIVKNIKIKKKRGFRP